MSLKFTARRDNSFGMHVEIRAFDEDTHSVVQPVVMEQVDRGTLIPVAMQGRPQDFQSLVDQLWECGVRPHQASGSTGQLGAITRHLEDMRSIVGHSLKTILPGQGE